MRTHDHAPYVFSLGLVVTVLLSAAPAGAGHRLQRPPARPAVWWSAPPRGGAERGRLAEVKDKRRVYVDFFSFTGERDVAEIRLHVLRALASDAGLEVVSRPDDAEFALSVSAVSLPPRNPRVTGQEPSFSDAPLSLPDRPAWPTTLTVSALVRGAAQADGSHRPRVVWERSREVWSHAGAEAGSAVKDFVGGLKKARTRK